MQQKRGLRRQHGDTARHEHDRNRAAGQAERLATEKVEADLERSGRKRRESAEQH